MANHVSHASLPYIIKGARFTVQIPYLDADGDPTDPTTPDTEFSLDASSFADCAEEATTITGSNGVAYITFSGAETNGSMIAAVAKVASGPKNTILSANIPQLVSLGTGTLAAGSAGGGTLGTILPFNLAGCFLKTTGGTGGGGTGGAANQARRIITYVPSSGVFTVSPNWETTPSTDTTYDILLPEGVTVADITDNAYAYGTLSGTHSTTTADLGATAPAVDISGFVVCIPVHGVVAIIDSYNTGTGVATFSPATAATLANGNAWVLYQSPKASTANPLPVNVTHAAGTAWASGAITAASIASDAFTAAKFASDVTTELQTGLATAAALATVAGYIDTEVAAVLAAVDTEVAAIVTAVGTTIPALIATLTTTLNLTRFTRNTGSQKVFFKLVDNTDHVTPETSITVTATRSLNGAAFGAATGTVTEVGSGVYYITASAADMNAADVVFKFTGTGCDPTEVSLKTYT